MAAATPEDRSRRGSECCELGFRWTASKAGICASQVEQVIVPLSLVGRLSRNFSVGKSQQTFCSFMGPNTVQFRIRRCFAASSPEHLLGDRNFETQSA